MAAKSAIRNLVNQALFVRQLTPTIEDRINLELTVQGHISDDDFDALTNLMQAMDAGKIRLVARV
ncbi:hypothetical protein Pse7367_0620 [Thalassoporum mexicanum PCC 7367]|uniref:hypothetical protein n=1 Tax=Thalassoporum mexicanum TaxID=3457544 RepID=UPI00029FFFC3|nr:hypothetical protein [Pseudanabaena sp. PCC 7367]AFY68923.1 hypothetical protein Pse7367_0620 [Pseudanabaena sp. PCC 7367]